MIQSPEHRFRLNKMAAFAIVDDNQSSDSFPRQYRLTPGKYFVSVKLEVYSGRNRFTFTSDRLPFEVVESEARDE